MKKNFFGTEEVTLELNGWIQTEIAESFLKNGLKPTDVGGVTPIKLSLSRIRHSGHNSFPFISFKYDEAIWKVGVEHNGKSSWFIPAFDNNSRWLHKFNYFFGYPMRRAEFMFLEKRKSLITQISDLGGAFMTCHVEIGAEAPGENSDMPLLISNRGEIQQIQREENQVDFRRISVADVIRDEMSVNLFGIPARWDSNCVVHRGRSINFKFM